MLDKLAMHRTKMRRVGKYIDMAYKGTRTPALCSSQMMVLTLATMKPIRVVSEAQQRVNNIV